MKFSKALIIILLFIAHFGYSQSDKNALSYAQAYSSIRYFFPSNISDLNWRKFNYTQIINLQIDDNDMEKQFNQIFSAISPLIEFSKSENFKADSTPFTEPVYWQHYGFGKKDGIAYKSCIAPLERMNYLFNGIQFSDRVPGKFDSSEVRLKINRADNLDFSNNFLIFGWKTGKQIISKEKLQYDAKKNTYYTRLSQPFEDVFFRYFLEGNYGIDLSIESIAIIGYQNGNESIILEQDFSKPLSQQVELSNHHSVITKINPEGILDISSKEEISFNQIYEENINTKKRYFTKQLSNGLYMHFPLIIEEELLLDSINFNNIEFSAENTAVIAKTNLVDGYGHLLHFHPYFDASTENFGTLFSSLYIDADTCMTLTSVQRITTRLMFPVKDAHMYVNSNLIPRYKKYVGVSIEFIGKKCYVKKSNLEAIHPGDQIISFQGEKPWDKYQRNKKYYLKSDNYADFEAKRSVLLEDSAKQYEIIYKRNFKKWKYNGYTTYYSDYTAPVTESIYELKDGVYYVNLDEMEVDTFEDFLRNTPLIKGLVLDARDGIRVQQKFLSMLSKDTLFAPLVFVPKYSEPFQQNVIFDTLNLNSYIVGKAKKEIPIILIIAPRNISTEETFINSARQISHLKLAGNNSGGCNGMVTTYRGSGSFEVQFTGSIVKKNNGDPLYNVGYTPEMKVKTTKRDLKNNVDGILVKCVQDLSK